MIGLFGIFNFDRSAFADTSSMSNQLPDHLSINAVARSGASIGYATHGNSCFTEKSYTDVGLHLYVCGWIANCAEFATPNCPQPDAADVIAHLIKNQDLEGLARINGQFCAAVYDDKTHNLSLITDRNGSFPLYVWKDSQGIAFASQLYVMAGLNRIPKKADSSVIAELFTMQRTLGAATPIAGVKSLSSACLFQVDAQQVTQSSYWELRWEKPEYSKGECAEHLAGALRNAVRRQTSITENTGLLLSGGLDSRLVLAAASRGSLSCWTTAGYELNPELALAKQVSALYGAKHHSCVVSPEESFDVLDETVIGCGGLYPASTPVSVFLPQIDDTVTTLLTGHGLDYTLRGYYLPSHFLNIAGSRTRLPMLRPISAQPTGHDVLNNLRQGPPRGTLDRIIADHRKNDWWRTIGETLDEMLAPWLTSDDPYNAWDALILNNVSKHYAFTSMMAVRDKTNLANPAFDNEVFDIYLRMPPSWRCEGRIVQNAMRVLSPEGAKIPNANTHFAADLGPWLEIAGLLGRGALRRLKILDRPPLPSQQHSQGSWQNMGVVMKEEPRHRRRLKDIQDRADALCLDIISPDHLSACIDEHLEGTQSHTKLLRQLLTHDSWMTSFGITGYV